MKPSRLSSPDKRSWAPNPRSSTLDRAIEHAMPRSGSSHDRRTPPRAPQRVPLPGPLPEPISPAWGRATNSVATAWRVPAKQFPSFGELAKATTNPVHQILPQPQTTPTFLASSPNIPNPETHRTPPNSESLPRSPGMGEGACRSLRESRIRQHGSIFCLLHRRTSHEAGL